MADQGSNECSSSSNVVVESSDSILDLTIKMLDSQTYTFQVNKNIPVSSFKEKIANEIGVPVGQQRLIFRGRVLKDDHPLSEYHLENGHTLHLVVRQQTQPRPSSDISSGETNANNSNQGNDTNGGTLRNRVGQIAHSVVLGTYNVGDQGEGIVPDLSRVIGAVLNSFGIGSQPANNDSNGMQPSVFSNASGQAPSGNGSDGTPANVGGQGQVGNQSQSGQALSGQPFQVLPQVVQIPLTATTAIPIPSLQMPIPDSLDTLSEFINRMEWALSQNGYQLDASSAYTREQPRVELPRNARGLSTPDALCVVLENVRRLLSGPSVAALSRVAGRLEQEGASSDPAIRGQIQTEAMQVGLAMQHLGALLLELGRTILTLRMGRSPAESYVNAGPAVYISSSGPNPIMVQPFPFQTSSLFSGASPASNSTTIGPVGIGTAPRHVNIHIHAGTSTLTPIVSAVGSQQSNGGVQGEYDNDNNNNSAVSGGSGSVRVLPVRNVIAAAVPSRPTGLAISTSARPGLGVSVSQGPPGSASFSSVIAEVNTHIRDLVNNMQGENRGASGTESPEQRALSGPIADNEVNEQPGNTAVIGGAEESEDSLPKVLPESNDLKPQLENMGCPSSAKDVSSCSMGGYSTFSSEESTRKSEDSSESALKFSEKNALPEGPRAAPLGLGLGGLERKKRMKQPKLLGKSEDSGIAAPPQGLNPNAGTSSQQLLQSLLSGGFTENRAGPGETISRQQPSNITGQQSSSEQLDVSNALSQVLESPALDGLLAGISGQTGAGSPNVLRNMLQQLTQNPQIMNTVQQIAQQVDGREAENMLSGGSHGIDFSRMFQQMMPLVSRAFSSGPMAASQQVPGAVPEIRQHYERTTVGERPDDQTIQINVQPVARMVESSGSPGDVFRAIVENAVEIQNSGSSDEGLVDELCDDEVLAHEYMEMLRRDIQRRLQGDSGP